MSGKKKLAGCWNKMMGRGATPAVPKAVKTVVGKWCDGPIAIRVEGVGDGSEERYSIFQDNNNISGYERIDLQEFCQSDRPCISIIAGKDNVIRMAIITASSATPEEQASELCINRIASDLMTEVTEEKSVVYGNALFIASPWVHHYPEVLWGYLKGLSEQGIFCPSEED